jgi:hypothetical protein
MKETDANLLIKEADRAFNSQERTSAETRWRELAEFLLPSQNAKFFGKQSKADRQNVRVFDITGQICARDLASAMHSTVTSPLTKWMKLRWDKDELNNSSEGMAWLDKVVDTMYNELNESNFNQQMVPFYNALDVLGMAALLHETSFDKNGAYEGMTFTSLHLSEIAVRENAKGIVNVLYRKFKLTATQAIEKFGADLGEDVVRIAEARPDEELEFYQCIKPREEYNASSLGAGEKDRPFACYYIMSKGKKIVKETGYYQFPVYIPRWSKLPGETYGFGPGHIALGDVLTLNTLKRLILKGAARAVDPTMIVEDQNILSGDFRPGMISTVRNINGIREAVTQSRFDISFLVAEELKSSIKSAFYIDKLMLPPRTETGAMTAYETQQRLEQTQIVIGPALSQLENEMLRPLVERTMDMLIRHGKIPPVPDSVLSLAQEETMGPVEIGYNISFVNSLARSQRLAEGRNILSWAQEVGSLAQIKPEALDRINGDAMAEELGRIRDIPESLIMSDDEVAAQRQERQQTQEAAQNLQGGEMASNIVKNVNSAQGGIQQ